MTYMRIADFERAIDALGVQGLEIMEFRAPDGRSVRECYARMGELTFLKWDEAGRAFSFEQPSDMECCISTHDLPFLDYKRDKDFDLVFD